MATETTFTQAMAFRLAEIALGHVTREYPNKPGHVLTGPDDARTPANLHPVFHGSFDWHSCVHGHWLLARVLRRFPEGPTAAAIRRLFDRQFVPAKVAGECAYFDAPAARGFSRPYGWAWLLKLDDELARLPEPAWSRALRPLAATIERGLVDYLALDPYAVRVGTHGNTAFALRLAADYAEGRGEAALLDRLARTALRWYGADRDCPAWGEPGGDDFLSPTLIEAECMRRLLRTDRFLPWFDAFLPRLAAGEPATLLQPAEVVDRSDGKIAHLDGLNLSRAWCLRSLSAALPPEDARLAVMESAASAHLEVSLPHLATDYMGEHWLGTFALLAVEEGPITAR